MALVFMNLLLGLAVSDIAELERVSCVSDSVLRNFSYFCFSFHFLIQFSLAYIIASLAFMRKVKSLLDGMKTNYDLSSHDDCVTQLLTFASSFVSASHFHFPCYRSRQP